MPDPSTLESMTVQTMASTDGRWQAEVTRSETTTLGADWIQLFYVELKVTSLDDGTTWIPVSEWHTGGLGEAGPPRIFYWSLDGRYLFYTSTFDNHGVECALYFNIGDYLNRLNLSDGSIASLRGNQLQGILTISPDEKWIAYLDQGLVVRDLATAFSDGDISQDSGQAAIKWHVPVDVTPPAQISQIAWSPDNKQVLVTATLLGESCQIANQTTWALDLEAGDVTLESSLPPSEMPTPRP
jgi:hypothetical protein